MPRASSSSERDARRRDRMLRRRARTATAAAGARVAALATLSHEMREPLNGVLGMARLLGDTTLDEEQRAYAAAIVESGETLLTLVNDVLDLARIDAGKVGLIAVEFSLAQLADSLRRMLEPRAQAKGLALEIEVAASGVDIVRGDPGRLRQVIVNLVGNALKFTERGSVAISLAAMPDAAGGATVSVRVADTGIGMAPGTFDTLTAPFAQADPGVSRLYGGSGLGLLIARRILEAMGGGLACESAVDRGTCFTATCRLELPAPRPAGPADGPDLLRGRSLLVVDAAERTRARRRALATAWGLDVRIAASEREALVAMMEAADRGRPFDFALVDSRLGDGSAHELARRVRELPRLASTRLALLAAAGWRGDAARAQEAGFQAYLTRAASPQQIRACLQELAGARASRDLVTRHRLSAEGRPLRLLVVDDNLVNCRLATILLQRVGHEVEVAQSGADALALLEAEPFDLVLMDVQMPIMDGLETTRRIRMLQDRRRATIPIVAVTANVMQGDDVLCRQAGMDGYVTKPIDGASLIAALDRLAPSRAAAG